jgi:hypothetical protein
MIRVPLYVNLPWQIRGSATTNLPSSIRPLLDLSYLLCATVCAAVAPLRFGLVTSFTRVICALPGSVQASCGGQEKEKVPREGLEPSTN